MFSRLPRIAIPVSLVLLATTLAMAIVSLQPPTATGQVGVPYSSTFSTATLGGVPPYFFSAIGTLPPGLTLNGPTISGTPTVAGAYTFQIQATDSSSVLTAQGKDSLRSTRGMANAFTYGPYSFTITIAAGSVTMGAPISPVALSLLMLGLAAAGIFRMRQLRQS
jgi:hypothetical protein